jgi:hypothetical protein
MPYDVPPENVDQVNEAREWFVEYYPQYPEQK